MSKIDYSFIQEDFPHIDLEDAVIGPITGRLFLLCGLKFFGQCTDSNPLTDLRDQGGGLIWTRRPPKPCRDCGFHKRNCLNGRCPASNT